MASTEATRCPVRNSEFVVCLARQVLLGLCDFSTIRVSATQFSNQGQKGLFLVPAFSSPKREAHLKGQLRVFISTLSNAETQVRVF